MPPIAPPLHHSITPRLVAAARILLATVAPRAYRKLSWYRNEGRLLRITNRVIARHGPFVLGGPFKGMRYLRQSAGSVLNPKLVGSYEAELHPALERVIAANYSTLIDIGCAEGYYAVGLLLRMPGARCMAFDSDLDARRLCQELAELNGVADRLSLRETCDTTALKSALTAGTFVLSDCEGAELDLLNPAAIPTLARCDLLVELHDFLRPGLGLQLRNRFAATHEIHVMDQQDRQPGAYPQIRFLSPEDRRRAVHEFRPARMQWAFFTSKEY